MTSQPIAELPDPTTLPTAGTLPRLAAFLVDKFVTVPALAGVYYFMVPHPSIWGIVACWVVVFLYKPLAEHLYGMTVGKWLLRVRVSDRLTNQPPSLNQSFVRYLPFAVAEFATLFIFIRVFQSPELAEITSLNEYVSYTEFFPLRQNLLVSFCNNFPIFSGVWLILDPWSRALHDRWAQTFVLRKVVAPEG